MQCVRDGLFNANVKSDSSRKLHGKVVRSEGRMSAIKLWNLRNTANARDNVKDDGKCGTTWNELWFVDGRSASMHPGVYDRHTPHQWIFPVSIINHAWSLLGGPRGCYYGWRPAVRRPRKGAWQPLVELEQQQARHQAPTPVGRSSGQGAGDQGAGELSPFSSAQGLRHPSNSGPDMSPINGTSLPAEVLVGKPGALSPPAPSSKHSSNNSAVEYAWMKEKKPSRKQQHLSGGPPHPPGHHPSSVMQHQVSAMPPHQTALNGLGKLPSIYTRSDRSHLSLLNVIFHSRITVIVLPPNPLIIAIIVLICQRSSVSL